MLAVALELDIHTYNSSYWSQQGQRHRAPRLLALDKACLRHSSKNHTLKHRVKPNQLVQLIFGVDASSALFLYPRRWHLKPILPLRQNPFQLWHMSTKQSPSISLGFTGSLSTTTSSSSSSFLSADAAGGPWSANSITTPLVESLVSDSHTKRSRSGSKALVPEYFRVEDEAPSCSSILRSMLTTKLNSFSSAGLAVPFRNWTKKT